MKSFKGKSREHKLYKAGLIAAVVLLLLILLQNVFSFSPAIFFPPCMFHRLTGLSCPGCGCTRSVLSLFSGHILCSLYYNPIILYCVILYVIFMLSHTWELLISRFYKSNKNGLTESQKDAFLFRLRGLKARNIYVYIGIAIILVQWVIRMIFEIIARF